MSKTIRITAIVLLLVVSLAFAFGAGCALGYKTPPVPRQGFDTVAEVWNLILQDYVDKDSLDTSLLSQGAIKGMLEALDDPYTSYLDAEAYHLASGNMEGKFEGIGAEVAVEDEQLMIIAPIANSPAAKAGIRAGDKIIEVDGRPTSEMSLAEAVLNIRGLKGSPVKLLILHQGESEPVEIEIIRAEIEMSSVNYEMRGDIAYIGITHFSQRTNEELSHALQLIIDEAPTGIVLDLRRNPGGILQTVIDVTSHFLEDGVVGNVVDNQGNSSALTVKSTGVVTDLPLVVLVNSYSASGSELLAGALQDYARATIAGTQTYGKGSVNVLRQLGDGSGLRITTARWFTPSGRQIEGEGIEPDYELKLEGEAAIQWAIDYLKSNE
ncbi:MAG: peptidase S41 [Dehalococcoidales bacterium]|jgi:carboxyl-terminal processing protease|nr:peptidase S41 [Dehalococcoidales bacterium]